MNKNYNNNYIISCPYDSVVKEEDVYGHKWYNIYIYIFYKLIFILYVLLLKKKI